MKLKRESGRKGERQHYSKVIMHALSIEELTRQDIRDLALVLHHNVQGNPETRRQIIALIEALPHYVQRSKVFNLLPAPLGICPPGAKCCALHKRLNGHVIRSIYSLVTYEIGERLDKFAANLVGLSAEQRSIIQSLRELHSMWLKHDEYQQKFLVWPQLKWHLQEDGCEACILARIAQNSVVLTNLRTILLSRTRTRTPHPPPRLIRWVEESMRCHGPRSIDMFMRSGGDAVSLKRIRKDLNLRITRSYSRKILPLLKTKPIVPRRPASSPQIEGVRPSPPLPPSSPDKPERAVSPDLVNEIIDYYLDSSSSQSPSSNNSEIAPVLSHNTRADLEKKDAQLLNQGNLPPTDSSTTHRYIPSSIYSRRRTPGPPFIRAHLHDAAVKYDKNMAPTTETETGKAGEEDNTDGTNKVAIPSRTCTCTCTTTQSTTDWTREYRSLIGNRGHISAASSVYSRDAGFSYSSPFAAAAAMKWSTYPTISNNVENKREKVTPESSEKTTWSFLYREADGRG